MRISDWSSDVCSSDLGREVEKRRVRDYVGAMNAPASPQPASAATPSQRSRKPDWIRVKAPTSPGYAETRKLMRELNLHTVCDEAACPNIGECWTNKHATAMILGETCTRDCASCHVKTGMARPVDLLEPKHTAIAAAK